MPPDAHADQSMAAYYVFEDWVERDPDDAGWGLQPEPPPPPPPLRLDWVDYSCCFLIGFVVCITAVLLFLGGLLDDEYSVVNVLAPLQTRMHMLAVKSSPSSPAPSTWTALALLPTCPEAPALSMPPGCYEWEKLAAGSSGSADSNWRSHEQDGGHYKAAKCFDGLVRDAAWTCDEQEDDYNAAMTCSRCCQDMLHSFGARTPLFL